MTADPPPLLVLQAGCDACAGAYVATGDLACRLRAMPVHTALAGQTPPTPDERAGYLTEAGGHARADGWVMLPGGRWRCPRCRRRWADAQPRRYTLREAAALRRVRR